MFWFILLLFFIWVFLKVRNTLLVDKLQCEEHYKELCKNTNELKFARIMRKGIKATCIAIIAYIILCIVMLFITLGTFFLTLGGTAAVDTGSSNAFYEGVTGFWGTTKYFWYVVAFLILMLWLKSIYVNYQNYKSLKNNPNLTVQNTKVPSKNLKKKILKTILIIAGIIILLFATGLVRITVTPLG